MYVYIYKSVIVCRYLFILSKTNNLNTILCSPIGWGGRIHRLHLCRGLKHPPLNECPVYDTKQSDGEVLVMLEFGGIQSILSLPSLPGLLWLEVVAPDRVLSMGQVKLLDFKLILN